MLKVSDGRRIWTLNSCTATQHSNHYTDRYDIKLHNVFNYKIYKKCVDLFLINAFITWNWLVLIQASSNQDTQRSQTFLNAYMFISIWYYREDFRSVYWLRFSYVCSKGAKYQMSSIFSKDIGGDGFNGIAKTLQKTSEGRMGNVTLLRFEPEKIWNREEI